MLLASGQPFIQFISRKGNKEEELANQKVAALKFSLLLMSSHLLIMLINLSIYGPNIEIYSFK